MPRAVGDDGAAVLVEAPPSEQVRARGDLAGHPGGDLLGVRATFQIRTSSMTPLKNPDAAPVEFSALPIAAC